MFINIDWVQIIPVAPVLGYGKGFTTLPYRMPLILIKTGWFTYIAIDYLPLYMSS